MNMNEPGDDGGARNRIDRDELVRRIRRRHTLGQRVMRIVVIAALTYVGVCLLASLFQRRFVYIPSHKLEGTPADVGLKFEQLTLVTDDGVEIDAWYVPAPQAKASAIFCHGNAGNISHRLHTIETLHNLDLNVLIFDYRGYGNSKGTPSEEGTYEDAGTAWRHLVETRGESPDRIVVVGRSLGGAIAIELARRKKPAALVVESTFTKIADVGQAHFPFIPVRLLLRYRYDSIGKVPHIECPKLFFHGNKDGLIDLSLGKKLYEAAAEPKRFIETPGGHNEAGFEYSPEYTKRMAAFLDEVLSP
ncbi:MAG: alpha/beta hydrolase [Phycisphaerae bacterium]|jgi:fermentation-respiration switch protein FrsA (DUF1100 family)